MTAEHGDRGFIRSALRTGSIVFHAIVALYAVRLVFWLMTGSPNGHTATIGESIFTLAGSVLVVICVFFAWYHTTPLIERALVGDIHD